MSIRVDQDTCIGCQNCALMCPDVFRITDSGAAEAYAQENVDCARKAAEACPVGAISVD